MAALTPKRIALAYFDTEASRRDAERVVRENQIRAEHSARTGMAPTPAAVIVALDAALTRSLAGEA